MNWNPFGYDSEELKQLYGASAMKMANNDSMMNMAMALLKAGSPQVGPRVGMGEALADAYASGRAGFQDSLQNRGAQIKLASDLRKVSDERNYKAKMAQLLGVNLAGNNGQAPAATAPAASPGVPAPAATSAEAPQLPGGPAGTLYSQITGGPGQGPQVSPQNPTAAIAQQRTSAAAADATAGREEEASLDMASKYLKAAQFAAATGNGDDANAFMRLYENAMNNSQQFEILQNVDATQLGFPEGSVLQRNTRTGDVSVKYNPLKDKAPDQRVQVNLDTKMNETFLKMMTDDWDGVNQNFMMARDNSASLDDMMAVLNSGFQTGSGAELTLALNKIGQFFNPEYKAGDVTNAEAFQAASTRIILPEVKKLGVNPTDTDLRFIVTGSPTLSKSVEGNRVMIGALKLSQDRSIAMQQWVNQWRGQNLDLVTSDPAKAQLKYVQDRDNFTQNNPLWTTSAMQLRNQYYQALQQGAVSGQTPVDPAQQDRLRKLGLIK